MDDMQQAWLDKTLKRQLKAAAATEGRTLKAVLDEAVREYLTRRQYASYTQTRAASDHIAGPNE